MTEAHVDEQLAQSCYMKVERLELNMWPIDHEYDALTITIIIIKHI